MFHVAEHQRDQRYIIKNKHDMTHFNDEKNSCHFLCVLIENTCFLNYKPAINRKNSFFMFIEQTRIRHFSGIFENPMIFGYFSSAIECINFEYEKKHNY